MKINTKTRNATKRNSVVAAQASVNAKAKASKKAKVEKTVEASLQSQSNAIKIGSLIVIGNRGTAFPLAWPSSAPTDGTPMKPFPKVSFKTRGLTAADLGHLHSLGKCTDLIHVDSCSWISSDSSTFQCYKTSEALKKGIVKAVRVEITPAWTDNAKPIQATVYVPGDWKSGQGFDIRLACADTKSGRVETTIVSGDRRNTGLQYTIRELKSAKDKASK